jgi:catechol 2,3-dioxygenase-like lactoylglutathione lyase family enzyme
MTESIEFPGGMKISQIRVARPTRRLDAVVRFYRDGLGLPVIDSFRDHAGYDGVMLGLPGTLYHLEFTSRGPDAAVPGDPVPDADDLLVFYCADGPTFTALAQQVKQAGAVQVAPDNPYWNDKGLTVADPDGRRIVICRPVD